MKRMTSIQAVSLKLGEAQALMPITLGTQREKKTKGRSNLADSRGMGT